MSAQRMLIVDDEPAVRGVVARFFEREAYDVVEASNRREALDILADKRFDLVLTDLKMPGLNGLELLERIRHLSPKTVVLIFTAFPSAETTLKALELHSDGYLTKPISLSQLKSRITQALMRRRWQKTSHPRVR